MEKKVNDDERKKGRGECRDEEEKNIERTERMRRKKKRRMNRG